MLLALDHVVDVAELRRHRQQRRPPPRPPRTIRRALADVERERLLAQHVDAAAQEVERDLLVGVRRRADDDGVEPRVRTSRSAIAR